MAIQAQKDDAVNSADVVLIQQQTIDTMREFLLINSTRVTFMRANTTKRWKMIFRHFYGRYPRDNYIIYENLDYWWYMFRKTLLRRKLPVRPSRPPRGSTDPLWDDLFIRRKALDAYAWAQSSTVLELSSEGHSQTPTHFVKTA